MIKMKFGPFTRITKQAARKIYESGGTIYMTACKMRPDTMHGMACPVHKYDENTNFEKHVTAFWFYNCTTETGKYPAYWVKGDE